MRKPKRKLKTTAQENKYLSLPRKQRPRSNIQLLNFLFVAKDTKVRVDVDLRENNQAHFYARVNILGREEERIPLETLTVTDEQFQALRTRSAYIQGYGKELNELLLIVLPALKEALPYVDISLKLRNAVI